MPRTGPRRPLIALRISDEGIGQLDELAIHDGLVKANGEPNRSDIIRKLLKEAILARMAKGWRPGKARKATQARKALP